MKTIYTVKTLKGNMRHCVVWHGAVCVMELDSDYVIDAFSIDTWRRCGVSYVRNNY